MRIPQSTALGTSGHGHGRHSCIIDGRKVVHVKFEVISYTVLVIKWVESLSSL